MAMRRLLPVALGLLVASCAAAVSAPAPTPNTDFDSKTVPSEGGGMPSPSAPAFASPAPPQTPRASLAVLGNTVASAQADFDCDGRADRLEFITGINAARQAPKAIARLVLATGAMHELALDAVDDSSSLIGTADVNGDRCDDAIVSVGHGASTTWTSFLVYDRGELRRVEENGKPVMFLFGGSVRHGNAVECRQEKDASEIVARGISDFASDLQWDTVEDVHRWSTRSQLVLWSTTRAVIAVSVPNAIPPDQDRYWGLSCGSVKLAG